MATAVYDQPAKVFTHSSYPRTLHYSSFKNVSEDRFRSSKPFYGNIMYDKRVVRGNTVALRRMAQEALAGEVADERRKQRERREAVKEKLQVMREKKSTMKKRNNGFSHDTSGSGTSAISQVKRKTKGKQIRLSADEDSMAVDESGFGRSEQEIADQDVKSDEGFEETAMADLDTVQLENEAVCAESEAPSHSDLEEEQLLEASMEHSPKLDDIDETGELEGHQDDVEKPRDEVTEPESFDYDTMDHVAEDMDDVTNVVAGVDVTEAQEFDHETISHAAEDSEDVTAVSAAADQDEEQTAVPEAEVVVLEADVEAGADNMEDDIEAHTDDRGLNVDDVDPLHDTKSTAIFEEEVRNMEEDEVNDGELEDRSVSAVTQMEDSLTQTERAPSEAKETQIEEGELEEPEAVEEVQDEVDEEEMVEVLVRSVMSAAVTEMDETDRMAEKEAFIETIGKQTSELQEKDMEINRLRMALQESVARVEMQEVQIESFVNELERVRAEKHEAIEAMNLEQLRRLSQGIVTRMVPQMTDALVASGHLTPSTVTYRSQAVDAETMVEPITLDFELDGAKQNQVAQVLVEDQIRNAIIDEISTDFMPWLFTETDNKVELKMLNRYLNDTVLSALSENTLAAQETISARETGDGDPLDD